MSATSPDPVRFAVVGADHAHVFGQVEGLLRQGCELAGIASGDPEASVAARLRQAYPEVPFSAELDRFCTDESIDLIVTAAVPADRGPIAVRAMRHGKDVIADKPGATTLEQLAELEAAAAETGRFWSVTFSERFEVPAVAKAGEIVRSGRIGQVVQTLGLGPHRIGAKRNDPHLAGASGRPDWFYDPARYGGILCDIASHQIDQFLWFTDSDTAEVVASTVANYAHPDTPGLQDFGEVMLRSATAQGYVRVDWYTPQGLPTWGDGRLTILGTEGYLELRKYVDIAGRPGTNHLFCVDDEGTNYIDDAPETPLEYYPSLVADVRNRTQTANPQARTFEATRLALTAQASATVRGHAVV